MKTKLLALFAGLVCLSAFGAGDSPRQFQFTLSSNNIAGVYTNSVRSTAIALPDHFGPDSYLTVTAVGTNAAHLGTLVVAMQPGFEDTSSGTLTTNWLTSPLFGIVYNGNGTTTNSQGTNVNLRGFNLWSISSMGNTNATRFTNIVIKLIGYPPNE